MNLGIAAATKLEEWLEDEQPEWIERAEFERVRPRVLEEGNYEKRIQENEEANVWFIIDADKTVELMEAIGEVVEE